MIGAKVVQPPRYHPHIGTVVVHHPNRGRRACFRSAKNNVPTVQRLACSKIPAWNISSSQRLDRSSYGIEATNLGATPRQFRLEVAIEMVEVGLANPILPSDLGTLGSLRKKNIAVTRPRWNVGTTTSGFRVAIRGCEPHALTSR